MNFERWWEAYFAGQGGHVDTYRAARAAWDCSPEVSTLADEIKDLYGLHEAQRERLDTLEAELNGLRDIITAMLNRLAELEEIKKMPRVMQLQGRIRDEISKWPDADWPVMSLETAKKLAEDVFRQYELCKGNDSCTLLMAIVDSAEDNFFSATGRVGI